MKFTRIISYIFTIQYLFSANFTGQVTDVEKNPLKNVNIYTLLAGTQTDSTGSFTIDIDSKDIITISHIGYRDVEYIYDDIPNIIQLHASYVNLNQVLVNGMFKSGSLNNITESLTVIDPKSENGINSSMVDYINSVPNINYISGTSQPRYFRVRGVGEISQFAGEGAPIFSVSYYIDDMDLSGIGTIGNNFGIDNIQIYKGSQNLTYGYNSLAGCISSYSVEPTYYKNGLAKLGFNSDGGYEIGLNYSFPFLEKLLSTMTLHKNYSNGYIKNNHLDIKNSNQIDENLLRYKILWIPSKNFNSKLTILYYKNNNGYDIWFPDNNGSETYTDSLGTDNLTVSGVSWVNNMILGDAIYKLTFSSTENEILYSYDGDWGNVNYWENLGFDSQEQGFDWSFFDITKRNRNISSIDIKRSEELNNTNIVLGMYLGKIKENDQRNGYMYDGLIDSINTVFNIDNYSFYGNIDYPIKDFIFSFGGRYDNNLISYKGKYYLGENLENNLPLSYENQGLSVVITLSHKLNSYINHHINLSNSYKPGGLNQSILEQFDESLAKYEKESMLSMEYGLNVSTKHITSKFSIFSSKRVDPQIRLYYQPDTGNPLSFDYFTANATEGSVSGIEFQISGFLNKNLSISQDIGLLKSTVDEYTNSLDNTNYEERETAHSPSYNYKTSFYYSKDNIDASLVVTGMDDFYFDDQANDKSSPYSLTHLSLGYNIKQFKITLWKPFKITLWKPFKITLWGKNIFDKKYATRGYIFDLGIIGPGWPDGPYGGVEETENNKFISGVNLYKAYGPPRTIGLSITYTF